MNLNQEELAYNNSKTFGMVASGSQLATKTGVDILKNGGNAADACLAMAGVLNVTLPMSCGLGGDLFLLYYCAAEKKVYSLNGAGTAPSKINAEYFINNGYSSLPLLGITSSAVPSAPAAYFELLNKFGSMPLKKIWQPAIQYAIDGFEVTPQLSHWLKNCHKTALNDRNLLDIYYKNGEFYNSGETLQQKKLGVTLEKVANQGRNFFYQGEIADKLIATSKANNGFFTKEDLSNFSVQFEEPLEIKFKGNYIYQNSLPSQGFMMLLTLKVLENINIRNEADLIHYMVETVKCINEIRGNYIGDPKFVSVDLDYMFSDSMIQYIRNQISYDKAKNIKKSNSNYFYGDTTYFYAIDKDGNVCSCIASLSLGFGAGITIGDTGIILNNRVGRGFTMHPSHPNCIQGGKRPINTLGSFVVLNEAKECICVGGTPGGDGQIQWNSQNLYKILVYNANIKKLLNNESRWTFIPGNDPSEPSDKIQLKIEETCPASTIDELLKKGHPVRKVPLYKAGGGAQLAVKEGNTWVGVSDPRQEGLTLKA